MKKIDGQYGQFTEGLKFQILNFSLPGHESIIYAIWGIEFFEIS